MIITLAHQKGGVGKTTLAINLATELDADLLDLDMQRSCMLWNQIRKSENRDPKKCYTPATSDEAEKIMSGYAGDRLLIVDCGGFDSDSNRVALFMADLIITPVAPSQVEIFGLQNFTKILKEASEKAGRKISSNVIINNADGRSRALIEDVQNYVSGEEYLDLISVVVQCRADFKKAYGAGLSVKELNQKSKATAEIQALADEIKTLF